MKTIQGELEKMQKATGDGRRPGPPRPGMADLRAEKPEEVPEFSPFPIAALPPVLELYVRSAAAALGCECSYVAVPLLAVLGGAVGNTRRIQLKPTWTEPAVIWSAVVADSGTLKSPAQDKAVGPMEEHEEELARKFTADEANRTEGDHPPARRRVMIKDVTIEKLCEVLEENPRGLLLARDELAGWLGSFTRYKGRSGGSDVPHWLEMHGARSVMYERKTGQRRSVFAPRAAVSVTGTIQPHVLARHLTAELRESGMAARLLLTMPPRQKKRWTDTTIDPATLAAYRAIVLRLLNLSFETHEGQSTPVVLTLSQEAEEAWVAFYNEWAEVQWAAEGDLASCFSKLEGYAARLALLHHLVTETSADRDGTAPIPAASIRAGVTLARWFAAEARRVYQTLGAESGTELQDELTTIIRRKGGTITLRELMRANCRRYYNAMVARQALEGLVKSGQAKWIDPPVNRTLKLVHDSMTA